MSTRGLATTYRTQGMSLSSQLLCPSLEPARDGVLMIPIEPQGRESLGLHVHACTLPRLLYFQGIRVDQDFGDFQDPSPLC